MLEIVSYVFLTLGVIFFVIGTIGLFRFIDLFTRLHAIAKIDNLGLGFIVLGLLFRCSDIFVALKLLLIWALALLSSATISFILSNHVDKSGEKPILKCDMRD
jgi:multicomponent Na+:H+ antiporter subunit G